MKPSLIKKNIHYLPMPNTGETYISDVAINSTHITASFVFAIDDENNLWMSQNQKRGFDIPGGHVEPGETSEQAGIRETYEEIGAEVYVIPIGYKRLIVDDSATKPANYKYPYPESFMQFYAGIIDNIQSYEENEECKTPVAFKLDGNPAELSSWSCENKEALEWFTKKWNDKEDDFNLFIKEAYKAIYAFKMSASSLPIY